MIWSSVGNGNRLLFLFAVFSHALLIDVAVSGVDEVPPHFIGHLDL